MKIKTLELNNFQNHKKSILELHPGINVISGSSRQGKSAVLRSLRLGLENKPSGADYIPFDNPKATTTASVIFEDLTVRRIQYTSKI